MNLLVLLCLPILLFSQGQLATPQSPTHSAEDHFATFRVVLEPNQKAILSAQVNTVIKNVYHRMGDKVTKGERLVQFDHSIFLYNVSKAQADVAKARTELLAKQQLFQDDLASLFDLKDAESKYALAEADLHLAEKNLEWSLVKAPFDGKVSNLFVEEGEMPSSSKEIVEVIDDSSLKARFLIPSTFLPYIKVGEEVTIYVHEMQQNFPAMISRIGPAIDPASSTVKIEATVANPHDVLRAGMTGEIFLEERKGT